MHIDKYIKDDFNPQNTQSYKTKLSYYFPEKTFSIMKNCMKYTPQIKLCIV